MSNRADRKKEIFKAIRDSMAAATEHDWTKTSPEISAAEHSLNEALSDYIEGSTSKANVSAVYKRWRDLHKTGAKVT